MSLLEWETATITNWLLDKELLATLRKAEELLERGGGGCRKTTQDAG